MKTCQLKIGDVRYFDPTVHFPHKYINIIQTILQDFGLNKSIL